MKTSPVDLGAFLPSSFSELLESKGADFIKRAGSEAVRRVVVDVMCGNNLRASTEHLTRQRLGRLNAATFVLYLKGLEATKTFSRSLPATAVSRLTQRGARADRWIYMWMLGLTEKGFQNVLRDDRKQLERYANSFATALEQLTANTEKDYGRLQCKVRLQSGTEAVLDWHDMLSLFCTVGSQTLAIRGSEKSTYGKLFERLVLGSVLVSLGFEQTEQPPKKTRGVFWLSSKIGAREADATLLVSPGQAIRFDLGFIGRGNPEITKDKVSRFERELEVEKKHYHSATCIIIDRVGDGSTLEKQARIANAEVIQMSISNWPLQLAHWLQKKFNYKSEMLDCKEEDLPAFFQRRLSAVSFEDFVRGLNEIDDA